MNDDPLFKRDSEEVKKLAHKISRIALDEYPMGDPHNTYIRIKAFQASLGAELAESQAPKNLMKIILDEIEFFVQEVNGKDKQ